MKHKNSLFYSILTVKCPKCRKGNMFPEGTLYHPKKFIQMNQTCPCCQLPLEPEPGYYFGAMFISYFLNTVFFIGLWWIKELLMVEINMPMMLSVILFVVVGLLPLNFRWSRVLWINIFVRYEGSCNDILRNIED